MKRSWSFESVPEGLLIRLRIDGGGGITVVRMPGEWATEIVADHNAALAPRPDETALSKALSKARMVLQGVCDVTRDAGGPTAVFENLFPEIDAALAAPAPAAGSAGVE